MTEERVEYNAQQVPDSELTPEELEQRIKQREWQEKEDKYDNSFNKVFKEGIGQYNLRPVTDKTDFSNLKVVKLDWNFWMKGEPYEVVRINGYPHQYDNCYYCYKQKDEDKPYNKKLIPFDDEWRKCLGNPKIEIYPNPHYRIKWDEYRTRFDFIGKLWFDKGQFLMARCFGKNFGECYAHLQVALNKIECHPLSLFHRTWRDEAIGRKIWYNRSPAIITKICDYDSDSVLSFYIEPEKEKLDCPPGWDRDGKEDFEICTRQHWDADFASGLMAEWDCHQIDWFRN